MGRAKEAWIEQMERGYGAPEGYICPNCVNDSYLVEWVSDGAEAHECTFCGATSNEPIAASFEDFVGLIVAGVRVDWSSPENEGIVYETAEGGWQANLTDTWDIISDMDISDDQEVIDAIVGAIDVWGWVPSDFYRGSESDRLTWGWDSFKRYVKNDTRFFFLSKEKDEFDYDEITPGELLSAIATLVRSGEDWSGLVRTIEAGSTVFRVRVDSEEHTSAASIGAPPVEFARLSNRMSPAGIPMFYGAYDYETALAETFSPENAEGQTISAGMFTTLKPLRILNLADLPDLPSVFDATRRQAIHSLRFLRGFARDMSQPIERDGREHIEYVPTQIITEYFRRIFRDGQAGRLDGIAYESSKRPGTIALVLFCENHHAIDRDAQASPEHLLRLNEVKHFDAVVMASDL